jgi:hypothetical protein
MSKDILNRCKELLAYSAESGQFIWLVTQGPVKAGWIAGSPNKDGYIQIQIDGTKYRAQRLAWLMTFGHWPEGVIDHKDGNVANNRIDNLRDVNRLTNQQNQRRAQSSNKSGLLGVSMHYGKYQARIRIDGKQVRLGTFETAEQASEAYNAAKSLHHKGMVK